MGNIGVVVGRPINGISLNGLEYLLDEKGDYIRFDSIELAKEFLMENGVEEDELEYCFSYQYHTRCLECGAELFLNTYDVTRDEHGIGCLCKNCGSSFNVNKVEHE